MFFEKTKLNAVLLRRGVMCCLPACVGGSSVSVCAGIQGSGWCMGGFLLILLGLGIVLLAFLAFVGLCRLKSEVSWVEIFLPLQDPCPSCHHARESSDTHVDLRGFGVLWVSWVFLVHLFLGYFGVNVERIRSVPYTSAEKGLPSLFSDDTCRVLRPCRALGGYHGQTQCKTSLPPLPLPHTHPWGKKGLF